MVCQQGAHGDGQQSAISGRSLTVITGESCQWIKIPPSQRQFFSHGMSHNRAPGTESRKIATLLPQARMCLCISQYFTTA